MQGSGKLMSKDGPSRNSLVVQWLGLRASTAKGRGLIPGWGTKIPQAAWCGQKKKKKRWAQSVCWTARVAVLPAFLRGAGGTGPAGGLGRTGQGFESHAESVSDGVTWAELW